ncbi:hypothetical protein [uncultured Roseivirga sp.]|uniref:hypothetical protein n=1 Tax=uncultured Roseivirga sp. TaxID=543088 RepID=UPI0030DCAC88|tara:strand:- start:125927 stop:126685 length:759 start_codon:yes stop_codon:yes gene_type:complete
MSKKGFASEDFFIEFDDQSIIMKPIFFSLFLILGITQGYAQFFVQKLSQSEIYKADEAYVVLTSGDTIRGSVGTVTLNDGTLDKINIRENDERFAINIEDIVTLAVLPSSSTRFDDMALLPIIRNLKNKEFIEVLPEGGWVFFEKIQLPGKQERYQLSQLMNPGFDSKIKVYAHPEAESTGHTKVSAITLEGLRDNTYFISVNGERVFQISDFQYRKRGFEKLFTNCPALKDKKLKWKEFPEDVFLHHQKCL